MAKEVKILIGATDNASKPIRGVVNSLDRLENKTKTTSSAFVGLGQVIGSIGIAAGLQQITKAFWNTGNQTEKFRTQFSVLLGSMDEAKARMAELSKFSAKTPFELPEVATASKTLQTLTEGALATGDGLRLVGDAAATADVDFRELAVTIGRAYSGLQSNRPIGESLARLQELGLLSGKTRNEIEKLTKASRGKEAWTVLQEELKKSSGGMEMLGETAAGVASTLNEQLAMTMQKILDGGLWEQMTKGLKDFSVALDEILASGAIDRLALRFAGLSQTISSGFLVAIDNMLVSGVGFLANFAGKKAQEQFEWFKASMEEGITKNATEGLEAIEKLIASNAKLDEMIEKRQSAPKKTNKTNNITTAVEEIKPTETKTDDGLQAKLEKETELQKEFQSKINSNYMTQYEFEIQTLNDYMLEKYELIKGNYDLELLLAGAVNSEFIRINKERADKEIDEQKRVAEHQKMIDAEKINSLSSTAGNLTAIMGIVAEKNKEFALAYQAAAIFETVISTYSAAQKSFEAAALIPGPLKYIEGAAAIGLGLAKVAKISSQRLETGGIVTGNTTMGDNNYIRANAGEMVLTKADQLSLMSNIRRGSNTNEQPVTINNYFSGNRVSDIEVAKAQEKAMRKAEFFK